MTAEVAPPFLARRSGAARFISAYGQEIVIACAILVLFAVVSTINPRFLGANNLNTVISGNAYIAVAAIGMSMVIITGHIDVSVGALIGVLATISGTLAVSGYPVWVAWIAPIFIGMAVNAVVGVLVAYGRLPSIVVTLGMLSIRASSWPDLGNFPTSGAKASATWPRGARGPARGRTGTERRRHPRPGRLDRPLQRADRAGCPCLALAR